MRSFLVFLCIACLAGCQAPTPETSSPPPPSLPQGEVASPSETPAEVGLGDTWETGYLIDPQVGFGRVKKTSTPDELTEAYGEDSLRNETIVLGEGETSEGSLLFPDDPTRRAEILWKTPERKAPKAARILGKSSQWATAQGISLGTPLAELEKLNGKPFKLTGFGWDYEGMVTSWEGGKLRSLGPIQLRLSITTREEIPEQLLGDQEVLSNAPGLEKLDPEVGEITMKF